MYRSLLVLLVLAFSIQNTSASCVLPSVVSINLSTIITPFESKIRALPESEAKNKINTVVARLQEFRTRFPDSISSCILDTTMQKLITLSSGMNVSCSGEYKYQDTDGRCYKWNGGSCSNKCLNGDATNCLRPSYSNTSCSCSYPVDFSPAYTEACVGNPSKMYQTGSVSHVSQPTSSTCSAPVGMTCNMSPLTYTPPVLIAGGPALYASIVGINTPFDVRYNSLQYLFTARVNTVNVHPLKFGSGLSYTYRGLNGSSVDSYISTNEFPSDPANFPGRGRTIVVSDTPGSMTPVRLQAGCKKSVVGLGASIRILFSDNTIASRTGSCVLEKDVQYYINIKAPTERPELTEAEKSIAYIFRLTY